MYWFQFFGFCKWGTEATCCVRSRTSRQSTSQLTVVRLMENASAFRPLRSRYCWTLAIAFDYPRSNVAWTCFFLLTQCIMWMVIVKNWQLYSIPSHWWWYLKWDTCEMIVRWLNSGTTWMYLREGTPHLQKDWCSEVSVDPMYRNWPGVLHSPKGMPRYFPKRWWWWWWWWWWWGWGWRWRWRWRGMPPLTTPLTTTVMGTVTTMTQLRTMITMMTTTYIVRKQVYCESSSWIEATSIVAQYIGVFYIVLIWFYQVLSCSILLSTVFYYNLFWIFLLLNSSAKAAYQESAKFRASHLCSLCFQQPGINKYTKSYKTKPSHQNCKQP